MSLTADTDHGVYDAVPAREADQAPDGATHAVFHEDGTLAGFASAAVAWDARRREIGYPATLPGAISLVCERDRPWRLSERTCQTCGGRVTRSYGGWGHARKPERRHVVKVAQ